MTPSSNHPHRFTIEQAQSVPLAPGRLAAQLFTHGTLRLLYYAPKGVDPQEPHDQDEVYIIISGSGTFQNGDNHHPFGPGDVIFAAAEIEHRFYDFTDDFATWVVFYGPGGGEAK